MQKKHQEQIFIACACVAILVMVGAASFKEVERQIRFDPQKEEDKAYLINQWKEQLERADWMLEDSTVDGRKRAAFLGMKARAKIRLGSPEDGIALYDDIIRSEAAPGFAADCIGTTLIDCGYTKEGREIYEKLLKRFPGNTEVLLRYGVFLLKRGGEIERALVLLQECSKRERSGAVYLSLTQAYEANGLIKEAKWAAKKSMEYNDLSGTAVEYLQEITTR